MAQTLRSYKTPVLLIEFDRNRPFMLVPKSDLTSEISAKSVLSKLVLLVLHYPAMRILWARDSRATANLFIALKQKQQQPSIEQAVTAMSHAVKNQQAGYEFGQNRRTEAGNMRVAMSIGGCPLTTFSCCSSLALLVDLSFGLGLSEEEKEEKNLSLTPHDILRKLPGVNPTNLRLLLQNVTNLQQLCQCSLDQLNRWMGTVNAKKLHSFLHGSSNQQRAAAADCGLCIPRILTYDTSSLHAFSLPTDEP